MNLISSICFYKAKLINTFSSIKWKKHSPRFKPKIGPHVGCPRERFLPYIPGHLKTSADTLQAGSCVYFAQYIKNPELWNLMLKSYFYMVEYCGNF